MSAIESLVSQQEAPAGPSTLCLTDLSHLTEEDTGASVRATGEALAGIAHACACERL